MATLSITDLLDIIGKQSYRFISMQHVRDTLVKMNIDDFDGSRDYMILLEAVLYKLGIDHNNKKLLEIKDILSKDDIPYLGYYINTFNLERLKDKIINCYQPKFRKEISDILYNLPYDYMYNIIEEDKIMVITYLVDKLAIYELEFIYTDICNTDLFSTKCKYLSCCSLFDNTIDPDMFIKHILENNITVQLLEVSAKIAFDVLLSIFNNNVTGIKNIVLHHHLPRDSQTSFELYSALLNKASTILGDFYYFVAEIIIKNLQGNPQGDSIMAELKKRYSFSRTN